MLYHWTPSDSVRGAAARDLRLTPRSVRLRKTLPRPPKNLRSYGQFWKSQALNMGPDTRSLELL